MDRDELAVNHQLRARKNSIGYQRPLRRRTGRRHIYLFQLLRQRLREGRLNPARQRLWR
jgi:hypothetical protein